jgi:hypothetical protein
MDHGRAQVFANAFELTHLVPQLNPGETSNIPPAPRIFGFTEAHQISLVGMSQEGQAAMAIGLVNQTLRVSGKRGHLPACSKDKQVIPGWVEIAIVNFFTNEEQDFVLALAVIAIEALDKNIVICGDDGIQSSFSGNSSKFLVRGLAIRIICVNVQSGFYLMHWVDVFFRLWV